MNSIALIPARGGSKGIPRKNIKMFNSKPLIYWSIKAASESKYIDRVIVSTEDQEIADIARSFSAEVPFIRPRELARDESLSIETVIHALNNIQNVKEILLLQPTSPLRRTFDIDEIFKLKYKLNAESVVSISDSGLNLDLFFNIDTEKKISPISKNFKSMPRQNYNTLYKVNGALYLSNKNFILKNRSFFNQDTIGYVMPEKFSIDIDSQLDWEIAELLMKKNLEIK